MIGVVSILGVLGLVMAGVIFLLEWPIIKITCAYMELKESTWRKAAKLASLIVLFNVVLSLLMALLKIEATISMLIGIILFVIFVYITFGKIYKATKRQKVFFTLILLIFSIVINALLVFLMMLLMQNIKIM